MYFGHIVIWRLRANLVILLWEAFMIGEVIIVFRIDEKVVEAIQAKIST